MNLATAIGIAVLALAVFAAGFATWRRGRAARAAAADNPQCLCGCAACPRASQCGSEVKIEGERP